MNRENTNEKVFKTATEKMKEEGKDGKTVTTFIDAYQKQKRKRACKIIRKKGTPIYKVSFKNEKLQKWIHKNRRVGRPRSNWTEETIRDIWETLKKDDNRYRYCQFEEGKEEHINAINEYANTH